MRCSNLTGTLLQEKPELFRKIDGETLVSVSLSVKGHVYEVVGYEPLFQENFFGNKVVVQGYVKTERISGKLRTYFKALNLVVAPEESEESSYIEAEGVLARRDKNFRVVKHGSMEFLQGVLRYKDGEGEYSLLHFVCKGKMARKLMTVNEGSKIVVEGLLLRKGSGVYEVNAKEIM